MISVVINTLNETTNIAACINSVIELADEVIVCDMKSNDDTQEISRSLGAHVVEHERTGFVEPARKFAIEQATSEWILVLDADERMTLPLARKLKVLAQRPDVDVVRFWSLYWYFGDWVRHGGFFNNEWPRFFRKSVYLESFREEEQRVHGNFSALMQHPRMSILNSDCYILHLAYPTVEQYVDKTVKKYSLLEAQQYVEDGGEFKLHRMIYDPLRSLFGRYIFKQGYRDGARGLILATLFGVHRFCFWSMVWFELDKAKQADRMKIETAKLETNKVR